MRDSGRPRHRHVAAVLAAAIVLATAVAARAAVTYFSLTFPERVAGAELGPVTDFESSHPGFGYGVRYRQAGWTIDLYIYDQGRAAIPDGPASEVMKDQLKQGQNDILELERQKKYARVEWLRTYVLNDRAGQEKIACSDFVLVHERTGKADSFLCLTGWRNKFVKFRLTTAQRPGSTDEAAKFVEAWIPVLWP